VDVVPAGVLQEHALVRNKALPALKCVYVKQILPSATTSILTHLSQTKMMMMTMTAIVMNMNKTSL
jgi:hypothetical protein